MLGRALVGEEILLSLLARVVTVGPVECGLSSELELGLQAASKQLGFGGNRVDGVLNRWVLVRESEWKRWSSERNPRGALGFRGEPAKPIPANKVGKELTEPGWNFGKRTRLPDCRNGVKGGEIDRDVLIHKIATLLLFLLLFVALNIAWKTTSGLVCITELKWGGM